MTLPRWANSLDAQLWSRPEQLAMWAKPAHHFPQRFRLYSKERAGADSSHSFSFVRNVYVGNLPRVLFVWGSGDASLYETVNSLHSL